MNAAEPFPIDLFLNHLKKLSEGLYYLSEGEYPLDPITCSFPDRAGLTKDEIFELAGKRPENKLEVVDLPYFLRNMTTDLPEADEDMKIITQRFRDLQAFLENNLKELKVYRVGEFEILALILGKFNQTEYAGLKTTVVET